MHGAVHSSFVPENKRWDAADRQAEGSVVYAVVRDGHVSSDTALWAKGRRVGMRLGWLMAALGVCLIPTIVGVLLTVVLVPFGLNMVRKASKVPRQAEMEARVADASGK